jgi:hypothetical protein
MVTDERHQSIKKRSEATHSHPAPRFEQHAKLAEKYRLDNTSLDDLLPILADSTAPLRSAAETCLHSAISWLDELNQTRWRNPKPDSPSITVREGNLSRLRSEIDEFRQSRHFEMLKPFREAFDENGQLKPELVGMYKYTGKDLFRCHVFTTNLVYFSLVLTEMLELLLDIERRNPKAKMQLPSKFAQHLVKSANDTEGGGNPLDMGLKEGAHTQAQAERDSVSEETLVDEDVEKSGKGGKAKKEKRKRIWSESMTFEVYKLPRPIPVHPGAPVALNKTLATRSRRSKPANAALSHDTRRRSPQELLAEVRSPPRGPLEDPIVVQRHLRSQVRPRQYRALGARSLPILGALQLCQQVSAVRIRPILIQRRGDAALTRYRGLWALIMVSAGKLYAPTPLRPYASEPSYRISR